MTYSIGQMRTMVKYMEERMLQYMNPDNPPAELCRSLYWRKTNKGREAWCGKIHCKCVYDTNGCYGYGVKETNTKKEN